MHVCNFLSKHFICSKDKKEPAIHRKEKEKDKVGSLRQLHNPYQKTNFFSFLLFLLLTYVAVDILIQIFNKIKATQVATTTTLTTETAEK